MYAPQYLFDLLLENRELSRRLAICRQAVTLVAAMNATSGTVSTKPRIKLSTSMPLPRQPSISQARPIPSTDRVQGCSLGSAQNGTATSWHLQ